MHVQQLPSPAYQQHRVDVAALPGMQMPGAAPQRWLPVPPESQSVGSWDVGPESPLQRMRPAPPTPSSDRRRFSRRSSLATTTSSHTCPTEGCGNSFPTASGLAHHQRYHDGPRNHVCSICDKGFLFPKDLKRHMKTHSKERHLFCNIAGCKSQHRGFYRNDHYTRHMRTHGSSIASPATPSSHTMSREPSGNVPGG
ncbi:hypothetical protein LTR85_011843 [Meristemomyces frigidus]|nr:hypothetical protein LTR85_011843 [Meristemomyces frigidus]